MKITRYIIPLLLVSLCYTAPVFAQSKCVAPVKELQAGVHEVDFGAVKIKLEEFNKLVKMKLISSLNEDWNSVSTEAGVGVISGYIGNGNDAKLLAELVVYQRDGGFDWAVLKLDDSGQSGTAYFHLDGGVKCLSVTKAQWHASLSHTIGAVTNLSAVNLPNDSLAGL